eukprot:UN11265
MKGENVNEGTLKTARGAIEKAIKRNATLAESAYGTMKDMGGKTGQSGTFDVVNKNSSRGGSKKRVVLLSQRNRVVVLVVAQQAILCLRPRLWSGSGITTRQKTAAS